MKEGKDKSPPSETRLDLEDQPRRLPRFSPAATGVATENARALLPPLGSTEGDDFEVDDEDLDVLATLCSASSTFWIPRFTFFKMLDGEDDNDVSLDLSGEPEASEVLAFLGVVG